MKTGKTCEFDLHYCTSSDCEIFEPCGQPAVIEYKGDHYCMEHYCHMTGNKKDTDREE